MKYNNREELQKYRENLVAQNTKNEKIKLLVGLGTCGTAAGAGEIWKVLEKIIAERKITNVELVKVGCVGYCHAEPTVEVLYPDGVSILLGNLTPEMTPDIIDLHIKNRCTECSHILKTNIAADIFTNGGK